MRKAQTAAMIENRTFDELKAGDSASIARTVTKQDIELFAVVSGDANPALLDPTFAEGVIAPTPNARAWRPAPSRCCWRTPSLKRREFES